MARIRITAGGSSFLAETTLWQGARDVLSGLA
jgi:hypothetical protein